MFAALLFPLFACGQSFTLEKTFTRSISGEFIIYGAPQLSALARSSRVASDTNFVRLEPALLAISAERIKDALGRRLEIKPNTPWRGQIYLAIHPANSLDESVTIISKRMASGWDYRVELPDVLSRVRFTRGLTGVVLLELANRGASAHSAEIPAWFVDGCAQQLLAAGSPEFIFSAPDKIVNGLPVTRINATQHGLDSSVAAELVLKNHPALTFEELSWPTDVQLNGGDGGAYRASAQIFVEALLDLKDGPARMRTMLESLPQFYNWQFAFQSAFRADFSRPVDVEKWWALQLASLAVRDPGSQWTPAISRQKLDALLSVPVEIRAASNSLPARAEISLQAVIRNLAPAQQADLIEATLRDLGLAQFRMAPSFAALTEAYCRALTGYLGKHPTKTSAPHKSNAEKTIKKLDALDAQRRIIESNIKPDTFIQPGLAR